MQKYSKYLVWGLGLGFFMIALVVFIKAQPQSRNSRIYHELQPYIPYKIEKKIGGLRIRNTKTGEKIEPHNSEVYNVLDNLEKDWGAKHLRLNGDSLIVVDDNNKTVKTIYLQNDNERTFVHRFFEL
jgi:hypothetical protein